MRKRDELTDPNSCMNRANRDEMTFVLLGRDAAAPVAIRAWIKERIRIDKNTPDDPQIREAEQCIAEGWSNDDSCGDLIRDKRIAELEAEVARLKDGKFTPDELQNLCHNLTDDDFSAFCDGCDEEQRKLFGKTRTGLMQLLLDIVESRVKELEAENADLRLIADPDELVAYGLSRLLSGGGAVDQRDKRIAELQSENADLRDAIRLAIIGSKKWWEIPVRFADDYLAEVRRLKKDTPWPES